MLPYDCKLKWDEKELELITYQVAQPDTSGTAIENTSVTAIENTSGTASWDDPLDSNYCHHYSDCF
jgi:hypothetical protein